MSTIEPISRDVEWSAEAAAMDAASRVKHDTPFFAIWRDENGDVCWSKANMTMANYAYFSLILHEMGALWVRKDITG